MNRQRSVEPASSRTTPPKSDSTTLSIEGKLSWLTAALLGAVLATSVLITGDSVSINNGECLPQDLLILLTAVAAGLAGLQVWPWQRDKLLSASLLIAALTFLLLSTVFATLNADGRPAWNNFWHLIALVILILIAAQAASLPGMSRLFFQAIVVCAMFQSTFALHQYFVSMPASRAEYLADPDAALLKAKIDAPPGSELRTQFENRILNSFEPVGTFALTNSLAVLLSGVIVALSSVCFTRNNVSRWRWWCARAMLVIIIGVWLLTKSRSGFLAVLVVGLAAIVVSIRNRRAETRDSNVKEQTHSSPVAGSSEESHPTSDAETLNPGRGNWRWILAGLAMLLAMVLFVGLLSNDRLVFEEAPKSIQYRFEYWQATAKMIMDHPWFGVGMGNFQSYYAAYKLPQASEMIADPHNWLFDLAANCSVPFLIVAIVALTRSARAALANLRNAAQARNETDTANHHLVAAFWIGALLSVVLTAFMQLLFGQLIDFDATILSILVSHIGWSCLFDLPVSVYHARRAALLSLAAMLVCLLASGCWQASGMAVPMALWLAIACPTVAARNPFMTTTVPWTTAPWKSQSRMAWAGIATTLIVSMAFIWQTWQPVQTSWALEQQAILAWQRGRLDQAITLIKRSTAADPISAALKRMLVEMVMDQAIQSAKRASPADFMADSTQVDEAIADLLRSDSVSSLNHSFAGECNLTLAASCMGWNRQFAISRIEKSLAHYREATARYPTNVALRVQVAAIDAWLSLERGEKISAAAQEQLNQAYQLSEITPHTNRKLEAQQLFLPPGLADRFDSTAILRARSESPWVQAEPLAVFLRKLGTS